MTDITERLRKLWLEIEHEVIGEAANEIERQADVIHGLERLLKAVNIETCAEIDEWKARAEAAEALNSGLHYEREHFRERSKEAAAEIERLRRELMETRK